MSPEEIAELERLSGGGEPPVPPTPPVEEPPAPPAPPADGLINWKEAFPEYESPDKLKEKLNAFSQFETEKTTWETERSTWSQKEKEYSEKILSLSSAKLPGETDEMYRLRKINESQPEKIELAKKFYLGNMSDLEVVKESMKLTPGLDKFTDAEMNDYLSGKYILTMDGVDPEDAEAVAARQKLINQNKINLGIEAASARERIANAFGNIEIPKPKTAEEIKAEQDAKVKSWTAEWKPVFDGINSNKLELSLSIDDDPKNGLVAMEIPAEMKQKYIQDYGQGLFINGIRADEKSQQSVTDYIKTRFIVENLPSIIKSVAKTVREMDEPQWLKLNFNVKTPGAPAHTPPKPNNDVDPNLEELQRKYGIR